MMPQPSQPLVADDGLVRNFMSLSWEPPMRDEWSNAEKKIARRVFDAALDTVLAKTMAEFKAKAASAATPEDMWSVESFLRERRREIDQTFDYRYSQLTFVFGRLILDGHLNETHLTGLSEDKLEDIRRYVSFVRNRQASA